MIFCKNCIYFKSGFSGYSDVECFHPLNIATKNTFKESESVLIQSAQDRNMDNNCPLFKLKTISPFQKFLDKVFPNGDSSGICC